MKTDFQDYMKDACLDAIDCVTKHNKEHIECEEQYRELLDAIGKQSSEGKALVEQLETIVNTLLSLENEYVYRRGFCDCAAILREMKLL